MADIMSMIMKNEQKIKGFTLIELLTAIAIIGILSSVVMANLSPARARARDSERITEVGQIVLAIEMCYNVGRTYPTVPLSASYDCGGGITLGSFINGTLPTDPDGSSYVYGTSGGHFVVRATLEQNNSAFNNNIDGTFAGIDCSNASKYYCKGK